MFVRNLVISQTFFLSFFSLAQLCDSIVRGSCLVHIEIYCRSHLLSILRRVQKEFRVLFARLRGRHLLYVNCGPDQGAASKGTHSKNQVCSASIERCTQE
jgi:hypothetical protein